MAEKVKKAKAEPRSSKAAAGKPELVEKKVPTAQATERPKTTEIRTVSHEEIQRLAHRYWAERGYPHGEPEQDWFRAEQELRGKAS